MLANAMEPWHRPMWEALVGRLIMLTAGDLESVVVVGVVGVGLI
jgi:hypothetical protein